MQFVLRDPYTYNVLGYNDDAGWELPLDPKSNNSWRNINLFRVGDLRLETTWIPREQNGTSITLTVGAPRNMMQIVWNDKGIELQKYDPATNGFITLQNQSHEPPVPGHPYKVALENVDHTARFFIDDAMVLSHETPWTGADALAEARLQADEAEVEHNLVVQRRPVEQPRSMNNSQPRIRIAIGGAATLAHTKVFRDLYYTQSRMGNPITANMNHPITLGADEFLAMGDNSRESLDSRMWDRVYPSLDDLGTRLGVVPRRFLLGKAFFVYWPAGFRISSNPQVPFLSRVPLVPNAGEMRLIR